MSHPEVAKVRSSNPEHEQGYLIKNVKDLTDEDVLFDAAAEKKRRREKSIALHGNKDWHSTPSGVVFLGVIASLLAWAVLHHYGFA
jgi:hypothetical protein